MTAYNLRRIINIIGINKLKEYLKTVSSFIFEKMTLLNLFLSKINTLVNQIKNKKPILYVSLK